MRCPNCGNENPPDYVFCDECGARLQDMGGADVAAANAGMDSAPMDSSPLSSPLSRLDSTPRMDSAPLMGEQPSGPTGTSDQQWQSSGSAYAPTGGMTSSDLQTGTADSSDLQDTWQYPTGGAQDQQSSGDLQSADPTAAAASAAPSVSPMASHASEVTPPTEDTMGGATDDAGEGAGDQAQTYTYVPDTSAATGAGTADAQQEESPMPDVVPIAAEAPPAYPGISPAAAGTPDDGKMDAAGSYAHDASGTTSADAGDGGGAWASSALAQLDEAQQALAGGDWARFGQSMAALRSMLEGAGQGGATQGDAGAIHTPAGPSTDDSAAAGTGISAASSPAADMSAYTSPATDTGAADTASSSGADYQWSSTGVDSTPSTGAGQQESAIPAVEPAAEAGTLGAAIADSAPAYDSALAGTGADATPDASYGDGSGNGAVTGGDMEAGVGAGAATSADVGADAGAATIAPATGATAGAASMLARLVVISTGAELP
ncbi:MAG TPA: zinc-ribbon domain-containing protein, partial [Chloroflexia bacterium]|nr:zinc-ribbon domain-containing protein [Chloroflexia bacterium]